MISFSTSHSGNIAIGSNAFEIFLSAEEFQEEYINLQNELAIKYYKAKENFLGEKDELINAIRSFPVFSLIDRQDAYSEKVLEENENLILAFNDNFLLVF